MIAIYPIRIVFGTGDILISHLFSKPKKYHGLGFAQIEPGEVGRQEKKWKDHTPPRQAEIYFSNIESLNVLIEQLENVRENFKEKDDEELCRNIRSLVTRIYYELKTYEIDINKIIKIFVNHRGLLDELKKKAYNTIDGEAECVFACKDMYIEEQKENKND